LKLLLLLLLSKSTEIEDVSGRTLDSAPLFARGGTGSCCTFFERDLGMSDELDDIRGGMLFTNALDYAASCSSAAAIRRSAVVSPSSDSDSDMSDQFAGFFFFFCGAVCTFFLFVSFLFFGGILKWFKLCLHAVIILQKADPFIS
jgi:hypothetical protein